MDGDLSGFEVADFAHEDAVWVLAEDGAEGASEGEADFVVDGALDEAFDFVFDGIFGGDDFVFDMIEVAEGGVEGGGFS